jgi:hypothetical protein
MFLSAKHAKLFWFAIFLSACMEPLMQQTLRAANNQEEEVQKKEIEDEAALAPVTVAPAAEPPPEPEHVPIRVGNWLTRH